MDNLPLECVEHILSFLPIADVFVCRSVCEKWKGAADLVIRSQKALTFFVVRGNRRTGKRDGIVLWQNRSPVQPDGRTPVSLMGCWRTQPNECNASVWDKRLEGFVRLEKLTVPGWPRVDFPDPDLADPLKSLVNAVIMRNASTLTTIDMNSSSLPFDHKSKHPVLVYGKLQNFFGKKLTPAAAAACPRLVRLGVSLPVSAEVLQNLPHETMQYLHVNCDTLGSLGIEALVTAVSRMTNLKDLKLICRRFDTPIVNPDPFTKLSSNMKQLEKINIELPTRMAGTIDGAIDRLVRNNPRLSHVQLCDANITAARLVSLSRLIGVQHLSFWYLGAKEPEFTTDDILTLLRGGSRQALHNLRLHTRSRPDEVRIYAELIAMEQDMGCTFSVVFTSYPFSHSIVIERGAKEKEARIRRR